MGLKVIATRKAQELEIIKLDDLIGEFLPYQIHLLKESELQSHQKGVAREDAMKGLQTFMRCL